MIRKIQAFIVLLLLCSTFTIQAELYKWIDEKGVTHYSDKAPAHLKADDISTRLNKLNISSPLSSPELMLRQAEQKDEERKQHYATQQAERSKVPTKEEACQKARRYLMSIKGRVVFVDEQGKEVKVSEAERKQRVSKLEAEIQQNCS